MPKYNVELCKHYDAGGKLMHEWYEISILKKRKKFWLFGPLVDTDEKWKIVKETLGSSGGDFKVVKRFYAMEDVMIFIKNNEEGLTDKIVRTQAFMGLGS